MTTECRLANDARAWWGRLLALVDTKVSIRCPRISLPCANLPSQPFEPKNLFYVSICDTLHIINIIMGSGSANPRPAPASTSNNAAASSTQVSSPAQHLRSKLPFAVSDHVAAHLISVIDPEEVAVEVYNERRRRFHTLIRRYINQIQYGCKNPACTTPTCLSCRKRVSRTPLRRYTDLSARTLACFLAEEGDGTAGLCPHEPVRQWDGDDWTLPERVFESGKNYSDAVEYIEGDQPAKSTNSCGHRPRNERTRESTLKQALKVNSQTANGASVPGLVSEQLFQEGRAAESARLAGRPNRDPKSFTQSLFNALPLKLLEWIPRPTPRNGFHRSMPVPENKRIERTESPPKLEKSTYIGQKSKMASKESSLRAPKDTGHLSGHVNGHVKEPPTKLPLKLQRQSSKSSLIDSIPSKERKRSTDEANGKISPLVSDKPIVLPKPKQVKAELLAKPENRTRTPAARTLSYSFVESDDRELRVSGRKERNIHNELDKSNDPETPGEQSLANSAINLDVSGESKIKADGPGPTVISLSTLCWSILWEFIDWRNLLKTTSSESPLADFLRQSIFYCLSDPRRLISAFTFRGRGALRTSGDGQDEVLRSVPNRWSHKLVVREMDCNLSLMMDYTSQSGVLADLGISLGMLSMPANQSKRHSTGIPSSPKAVRLPSNQDTSLHRRVKQKSSKNAPFSDDEAAKICVVGICALVARIYRELQEHSDEFLPIFNNVRGMGMTIPYHGQVDDLDLRASRLSQQELSEEQVRLMARIKHVVHLGDVFDDSLALDFLRRLLHVIANRLAHWEIRKTQSPKPNKLNIVEMILHYLQDDKKDREDCGLSPLSNGLLSRATICWLRTLLLREWDGKPIIRRASTVGTIILVLASMFEKRVSIALGAADFHTPFLAQRLNELEMPVEWLSYRSDNKTLHLLSHSFLFPPESVVTYFRAINYSTMTKSLGKVASTKKDVEWYTSFGIPIPNEHDFYDRMEAAWPQSLIIQIRRDSVLTDAMNQIWRRPRRHLVRPLRVRMGMDEGEEGVDHGGVQQEFFRILFGQALDPTYGMFVVDEQTRMTWFQSGSFEPLYKFEMLGILMSIAVFNSITLPVTFPLAFYRKLLGLKVKKPAHIEDGWPELTKGLQSLLDWTDGDVKDVFMRTYEFSFELFGKQVSVDMEKIGRNSPWSPHPRKKGKGKVKSATFDAPTSPDLEPEQELEHSAVETFPTLGMTASSSSLPNGKPIPPKTFASQATEDEASFVTNENRSQFVSDYIFWLTDKSIRPQFEAFARGFFTCLDRTALSIFTPDALRTVVEGIQEIDLDGLQSVTQYVDGYSRNSEVVRWFWEIVKAWDEGKKKQLLEFVTASDRIPVQGVRNLLFVIQRNGRGDDRLPTSMTCFGRLLLPEYSVKEALEKKLTVAVENCKGFGVA